MNTETTPLLSGKKEVRLSKQLPAKSPRRKGSPRPWGPKSTSLSPMIGGRSPSFGPNLMRGPPALDLQGAKKPVNTFVINYLCVFYFMISMFLKSTLPFMVPFFKGIGAEWAFGWYNGIYYLGRVLANSCVGWMARNYKIRFILVASIIQGWVGILCFALGVWYPSFGMVFSMLLGQLIQGFATGVMAGAIGMYIQIFHRGDQQISANFAIAYNVGDICGPVIALPFAYFGWGLHGLVWFLLIFPLVMTVMTQSIVPKGLTPIKDSPSEGDEEDEQGSFGINYNAKFFIMVSAALSAFYTSYEFNIPILYDSLGYDTSMMSVFLDMMAISALCGSYFAKLLPKRPQYLNEWFLITLTIFYLLSCIKSTLPYILTMVAVCVIGEFQGIVNSTVVLEFLTIQEYGYYRSANEGGRVFLQPIFAACLQYVPTLFFLVISILHFVVLVFLWRTKPLKEVDDQYLKEAVAEQDEKHA